MWRRQWDAGSPEVVTVGEELVGPLHGWNPPWLPPWMPVAGAAREEKEKAVAWGGGRGASASGRCREEVVDVGAPRPLRETH